MLHNHWARALLFLGLAVALPGVAGEVSVKIHDEGAAPFEDEAITRLPADEAVPIVDRLIAMDAEMAKLRGRLAKAEASAQETAIPVLVPSPIHHGPAGFYAGAEVVFARPRFDKDINYVRYAGAFPNRVETATGFDYDFEASPRVWLGYMGPGGLGLRTRYWQFDHSGNSKHLTVPGADPDIGVGAVVGSPWGSASIDPPVRDLRVFNGLQVHSADFEVAQEMRFCRLFCTFGGGLRYGRVQEDFLAQGFRGGVQRATLAGQRDYKGLGPVLSFQLERPIGMCGLALFAATRGAVLFGNSSTDALDEDLDAPNQRHIVLGQHSEEVRAIGELEIGLQWNFTLAPGTSLFARASYEGQVWHEAGSPSFTTGDLGFEGIGIAVGVAR